MRSIIVTGASAGIGAALARHAATRGWAVLLVARRGDRIAALAHTLQANSARCEALPCDVTAADAPNRIVEAATRAFGRIDVLVNNAGSATPGELLTQSGAVVDAQWQLHVAAPLRIARAALPAIERERGGLVFVGSGLARVPAPGYGAYAPAKAAVRAASIQLRRELRARGVFVTYVDPGVVATEFSAASGLVERPASWHATPELVAKRILQGIERRAARVNAVPWQTAATVAGEWFPILADAAMRRVVAAPVPAPPAEAEPAAQQTQPNSPPDAFEDALQPLRRRMERVNLPASFVRDLLVEGSTVTLAEAAMRWAGMPNKNERAALHEVLDALANAGYLEETAPETWRVRGALLEG